MTIEKLQVVISIFTQISLFIVNVLGQFSLPAVFTIGPDDVPEALTKYAKILTEKRTKSTSPKATGRGHVQDIVKGIIEGETRVIVSGMTMEEIFKERQVFKTKVIENVQSELNQFGLRMYVR